jgi:DNA-binding CsgD family transcriptional regulator
VRKSPQRRLSSAPDVCGLNPHEWGRLSAVTPSIVAAFNALGVRLAPLGVKAVAFAHDVRVIASPPFPSKPKRFGVSISEEWERRLETDLTIARNEPVAKRMVRSGRPLYLWRDSQLARSFSPCEKRYLDFYEDHGMRSGAVFPVHDRRAGTMSVLFLCVDQPRRRIEDLSRQGGADLHLAFTHFCEGLRVRHLAERTVRPVLSLRERECLCWVSAGCSTKEIADRLSLADATVDEYVASAMRKLEASSRAQACARAALLSLIQP